LGGVPKPPIFFFLNFFLFPSDGFCCFQNQNPKKTVMFWVCQVFVDFFPAIFSLFLGFSPPKPLRFPHFFFQNTPPPNPPHTPKKNKPKKKPPTPGGFSQLFFFVVCWWKRGLGQNNFKKLFFFSPFLPQNNTGPKKL